MKKGDVYYANLNPAAGSVQRGYRPVVVFQNQIINPLTDTVIIIPFTTNLRRARMLSSVFVPRDNGGLSTDSVALCHQIRVIPTNRLQNQIGTLPDDIIRQIEEKLLLTLDIIFHNQT